MAEAAKTKESSSSSEEETDADELEIQKVFAEITEESVQNMNLNDLMHLKELKDAKVGESEVRNMPPGQRPRVYHDFGQDASRIIDDEYKRRVASSSSAPLKRASGIFDIDDDDNFSTLQPTSKKVAAEIDDVPDDIPAPVTPATSTAKVLDSLTFDQVSESSESLATPIKRKSSIKKIDIKDINDDPDEIKEALNPFINGTLQGEPNFTTAALIRCFFIHEGVSMATNDKIHNFFLTMPFFAQKKLATLKNTINATIPRHSVYFEQLKPGLWKYKLSNISESEPVPKLRTSEDRLYNDAEENKRYQIVWVEGKFGGRIFNLEGYRFKLAKKNSGEYGLCLDCATLKERLREIDYTIGGEEIPKPTICSLRLEGTTTAVGCPWKPKGISHFCLKTDEINAKIRVHLIQDRLKKANARIMELLDLLEEESLEFVNGFDIKQVEEELANFLGERAQNHPFTEGQKLHFVYFLYQKGFLKYIGISGDVKNRYLLHPRGEVCGQLFETDDPVTMKVAPIGPQNLLSVMDIESSLIYLCKQGVLDQGSTIVNRGYGIYSSKDEVLKNLVEDEDDERHAHIVEALGQLLKLTEEEGLSVQVNGSTSISDLITHTKMDIKRNLIKLAKFKVPSSSAVSSQSSQPSSQSLIPAAMTELTTLFSELAAIHPYYFVQIECNLYFLVKRGTKIVKRYGTTNNLNRRKDEHEATNTIGEEFDMLIAPTGVQNLMFVNDIEAALIRLSKQNSIKFSSENVNSDMDVGRFESKLMQQMVDDKNHPRRKFLCAALNQLIMLTLEEGNIV